MSPFSFLGFNILLLFWKLWAQIFDHFYYSYGMALIPIKGFIINRTKCTWVVNKSHLNLQIRAYVTQDVETKVLEFLCSIL